MSCPGTLTHRSSSEHAGLGALRGQPAPALSPQVPGAEPQLLNSQTWHADVPAALPRAEPEEGGNHTPSSGLLLRALSLG